MGQKKRAWIYSRIDAPEDTHGLLKEQRKELYDYADQMDFEVVGSSKDIGSGLDMKRPGLSFALNAASDSKFDVLLIKQLSCIGRDRSKTFDIVAHLEKLNIKVYSPLEGLISASDFRLCAMVMQQEKIVKP